MKERSIREVIAHLEAQTEQLREREAWHAQQEAFHHGEQTRFAAELEAVSRHLESLRWAANLAAGALGKAAPGGARGSRVGVQPQAFAHGGQGPGRSLSGDPVRDAMDGP